MANNYSFKDATAATLTAKSTDTGSVHVPHVNVDTLPAVTGTVDLGATDNAVLDAIEADTTTIAGAVSGTEMQVDVLTMPTVTVTATNLDVQSGGADLATTTQAGAIQTAVELIDNAAVVLGTATYTEATSTGLAAGAVRRDADTTLVNTTNEWGPLQMDANGRLKVEAFSGETLPVSFTGSTDAATQTTLASALTALQIMDDWDNGASDGASVSGDVAHDAVDAGEPIKNGGQARTTNPTAVADADRVNFIADKLGKQVVVGSVRDLKANQVTTITASTSETTIVTAVASTFLDLYGIIISNTSATLVNVAIKDATAGTTRFNISVPANDTRGFMLPESGAIKQSATNNNWTATSSASVSSLVITALTVANT